MYVVTPKLRTSSALSLKNEIGPLEDPVTWQGLNYAGAQVAQTFQTKELVPVQPDFPLFGKSHRVTGVPA